MRKTQFLPDEEEKISALVEKEMSEDMEVITNHEVIEVRTQQIGGNNPEIWKG